MTNPLRSLTLRLLLTAFLWVAAALAVGGVVLSLAFRDYVVSDFDARLDRITDAMVGSSELTESGILRFSRPIADPRFAQPYSGWYWQVSVQDPPEEAAALWPFRSRSLWDQALTPDWSRPAFEEYVHEARGPGGQRLRVQVRDVVLPESEQAFRYMVAGDTAQIRDDIEAFNTLIAWSLGFLGAGLLVAVILQIWIGLRPLKAVQTGLARIRSGRAQRLEGDFPREIAPLVDEMNGLIAQNERVVERARTHVGNLAHALKTPLSVLANEARESGGRMAETVSAQTELMRRHIDHHLKRARAAGGGGTVGTACELGPAAHDLIRAMEKIHRDRGLGIDADVPADLRFRGERQDLDEILGNLLDNACKWANSGVRLSARSVPDALRPMLEVAVEDDGPGVDDDEAATLFARGRRLDETVPGSGLGLAIVRDIAELSGGGVALERSGLGGLKVRVRLPAAA